MNDKVNWLLLSEIKIVDLAPNEDEIAIFNLIDSNNLNMVDFSRLGDTIFSYVAKFILGRIKVKMWSHLESVVIKKHS